MLLRRIVLNLSSLVLVALLGSCAHTPETAVKSLSDQELTDAVIYYSGAYNTIRTVPLSIHSAMEHRKGETNPQFQALLRDSLINSFNVKKLYENVSKHVSENLSREEKVNMVMWYQSDLGQKILKLESFGNSPQGVINFRQYESELEFKKPPQDLIDFSAKVLIVSGYLEVMSEMVSSISVGIIVGFNNSLPADKKVKKEELQTFFYEIKKNAKEELKHTLMIGTMFTYQSLSHKEREEFMDFLINVRGKTSMVVTQGLTNSFHNAAFYTGQILSRKIASEKDGP